MASGGPAVTERQPCQEAPLGEGGLFGVLMVENQHVKDDAGCEVPLHG